MPLEPGERVALRLDVVKAVEGGARVTLAAGSVYRVVGPGQPWGDVSSGWVCEDESGRRWNLLGCHLVRERGEPEPAVAKPPAPEAPKVRGLFDE